MLLNCIFVGAGGFLGAVLRYLVGLIPVRETTLFPIKTLLVNVLGCVAIGCLATLAAKDAPLNARSLLFLKTGVCGGFTTFSTFALETTELLNSGHQWLALIYTALSLAAGIGAILAIQILGKR